MGRTQRFALDSIIGGLYNGIHAGYTTTIFGRLAGMSAFAYILAQSLAPDYLWPVLLFLVTLAVMASLRAMGNHLDGWRKTRHHLRHAPPGHRTPRLHGHD